MKFISIFFTAIVLVFNGVICADDLKSSEMVCPSSVMTIEAFETYKHHTNIRLDNGTLWSYKYKDLFINSNAWKLGDRVHIVYVHLEGYHLENVSCQGSVPVELINSKAKEIKGLRIQQIIEDDDAPYSIVLEDGTGWYIGIWSSLWTIDWEVGDRIIVTPQKFMYGEADHYLINVDKEEDYNLPGNARAQLITSPHANLPPDLNRREGKEWKLYVSNIWSNNTTFIVQLDNKTVWECSVPSNVWLIGDEIILGGDYQLSFKNLNNEDEVNAKIFNHSSEEIQTLYVKEIAEKENKIILNDGSIWHLGYHEKKFKKWRKGDRVIVTSKGFVDFDTSSHIIVNIDRFGGLKQNLSHRNVTLVH